MYKYYAYSPDLALLAQLIDSEKPPKGYELSLHRVHRDYKFARGLIKGEKLKKELETLRKLDIDFYYKPGNEHIGGHGAVDLDFEKKQAQIKCYGDWEWFDKIFNRWTQNLKLTPTDHQKKMDLAQRIQSVISHELFDYAGASLLAGKYAAALSATVVFIEDRLRVKLGPNACGLTGSDLALYAYKKPGALRPPLAYSTNAEDNAFFLLKGWFGLVRNLHGHQTSFSMTDEEVFAQMAGCGYILRLIDASHIK